MTKAITSELTICERFNKHNYKIGLTIFIYLEIKFKDE